jgi:hypothetical protein
MRLETGALIAALVLAGAGFASAQETTGTITGRAADTQRLPVPGVTVTVTGPQGVKTAVTDTQGTLCVSFRHARHVRRPPDLAIFWRARSRRASPSP